MEEKVLNLQLEIGLKQDSDNQEVQKMSRSLLKKIKEYSPLEAKLLRVGKKEGDKSMDGAKVVDPFTIGALAIAVMPAILPKLIEFLQAWVLKDQNRTLKICTTINGKKIELEGRTRDVKEMLKQLTGV